MFKAVLLHTSDAVATSCEPDNHDGPGTEPPRTATALQPPKQTDGPPAADRSSQEQTGDEAAEVVCRKKIYCLREP